MSAKNSTPAPPRVTAETARALVTAANQVFQLTPWKFMDDRHRVGLRDDLTGELRVATVMGSLGEVFGVAVNRGPSGLGWIHKLATRQGDPGNPAEYLEALDALKAEWVGKSEMEAPDLALLAAAGFKPAGHGCVWPKFQSSSPGWLPWFVTELDARQLTADLMKVARLAELFARTPGLFAARTRGEIAVIPAGTGPLRSDEIEWLPMVPPPTPVPLPVRFSAAEAAQLGALPVRADTVFELTAPLVPEMAFVDPEVGRPCIGRLALMSDRASYFIFSCEVQGGNRPLADLAGKVLKQGLVAAAARPQSIHVDRPELVAVLQPACAAIGIPVRLVAELPAAHDALANLTGKLAKTPRH